MINRRPLGISRNVATFSNILYPIVFVKRVYETKSKSSGKNPTNIFLWSLWRQARSTEIGLVNIGLVKFR